MYLGDFDSRDTVLEAGCGCGYNALAISAQVHRVDAFDISPLHIRVAQLLGDIHQARNTHFFVLDIYDIDSLNKQYDVIIISEVLEHIKEPLEVLRKARHVLKPEGRLVLSVPDRHSLDFLFGAKVDGDYEVAGRGIQSIRYYHHYYTDHEFRALLHDAGLAVLKYAGNHFSIPRQWYRWADLFVPNGIIKVFTKMSDWFGRRGWGGNWNNLFYLCAYRADASQAER